MLGGVGALAPALVTDRGRYMAGNNFSFEKRPYTSDWRAEVHMLRSTEERQAFIVRVCERRSNMDTLDFKPDDRGEMTARVEAILAALRRDCSASPREIEDSINDCIEQNRLERERYCAEARECVSDTFGC